MQESGLELVFLANRPKLLRFVQARLRDEEGAEDCLQDAWLRLTALDSGPIAEPLAYLYRMLTNLATDRQRSVALRLKRDDAWHSAQGSIEGVDNAPSAERQLLDRERLRSVGQVLAALPERTGRIFRMARVEGLPQKAIAAEFGISVSAVEKHVERAHRAVLQAQLALNEGIEGRERFDSRKEEDVAER